ncbi:MAG: DUF1385 domain-containing protein [Lachnospiraceae bacterium]|nr:DUF1385 domain-containing protein [Lachnospiraceae bacterium]
MQKSSGIGGQAVLEGIMMRNGDRYSVAVRKADHTIEVKEDCCKSICPFPGVMKVPILRGVVSFVDSMVIGVSSLMWSAEYAAGDEEDEQAGKAEKTEKDKAKEEKEWNLIMGATVAFSLLFSIGLFFFLPYLLASLLRKAAISEIGISVCEALIRVLIFMAYMFLISRMKDIQTVFAYHGAEHKCINCVENGWDLTVENVLKASRRHKRCGTSFLLFVIMVSVIASIFLGMLGIRSPLMRLLSRLLLIPVVAGLSYEILRTAGSSDNKAICALSKPGLALQGLVTREPDAEMVEVAIAAVEKVFDWRAWQGK